jgi:hypothetical protein
MDSVHSKVNLLKKIFINSKNIYYTIPISLRVLFVPIKIILFLFDVFRLKQWLLVGNEISSKEKLSIIYSGHEIEKNFLASLAYEGTHKESYIGKTWLWKIPKLEREGHNDCSMMVTEVHKAIRKILAKNNCLYVPCWIDGEVDTSLPCMSDSLKTDIRRIKKNNLSYEVTDDYQQFQNFYFNMHLPYITKTFGKTAMVMKYGELRSETGNRGKYNDLLLVKKRGENIAGMLLEYKKHCVYLHDLGVKDGNFDYVKDGAIGALFYFSTLYARDRGYKWINFGPSRAFFNVGVFQFKKKRSIQIANSLNYAFRIKPLSKISAVRGFFLNNPFIFIDNMNFYSMVFMNGDQSFSREDFERIYKNYFIKGISKIVINRFANFESRVEKNIPPEFSDKISVGYNDSSF